MAIFRSVGTCNYLQLLNWDKFIETMLLVTNIYVLDIDLHVQYNSQDGQNTKFIKYTPYDIN